MGEEVAVEFKNVRDFKGFIRDILVILNMQKVIDLLGIRGLREVSLILNNHKVLFVSVNGILATANEETWDLFGDSGVRIGSIKTTFIDEHFFLFGEGWKFLTRELIDDIFVLKDDKKASKEAQKLVEEEKSKAIQILERGIKKVEFDPNLALVIREWAVPIEPIKFFFTKYASSAFKKFVKKLAESYKNEYPIGNIEEIIKKIRKIEEETYLGYNKFKIDWSKIIEGKK
ncbi:MAG: hypothetical protein ACP6IP_05100 [Candidatus Njordarchaeia archaeon]